MADGSIRPAKAALFRSTGYAPCPTTRHRVPRFVDGSVVDLAAACGVMPDMFYTNPETGLVLVFVDPSTLSYHNLEPVVSIDAAVRRWWRIDSTEEVGGPVTLETYTSRIRAESAGLHRVLDAVTAAPLSDADAYPGVWTFQLSGDPLRDLAAHLHEARVCGPPLNSSQRGGSRFIFQSHTLALVLTNWLERDLHKHPVLDAFSHVNSVFRYNEFLARDGGFTSHYDTPYYDSDENQYSRYTLLLYLTASTVASPTLMVYGDDDGSTTPLWTFNAPQSAFQVVIMDQRHRHGGMPYVDGMKAFLRMELIHVLDENDVEEDDEYAASLFSRAVYMTKESLVMPEASDTAALLYEAAVRRRYQLPDVLCLDDVLYKPYKALVTDGSRYWLPRMYYPTLSHAVHASLRDYFVIDCKRRHVAHLRRSKFANDDAVFKYIVDRRQSTWKAPPLHPFREDEIDVEDGDNGCCSYHCREFASDDDESEGLYYASRDQDIVDMANDVIKTSRSATLKTHSVVIFGERLDFNEDDLIVSGDRIRFRTGTKEWPRANFAACWNGESRGHYVSVWPDDGVAYRLPDIRFTQSSSGFVIDVDSFRNVWRLKLKPVRAEMAAVDDSGDEDNSYYYGRLRDGDDDDTEEEVCERGTFLSCLYSHARPDATGNTSVHPAMTALFRSLAVFDDKLLASDTAGMVMRFLDSSLFPASDFSSSSSS